jgi:23S rRNA (guanosine2251-2'-O)-methyltransferase
MNQQDLITLPGRNPLREVLRTAPQRIKEVYCGLKQVHGEAAEIIEALKNHKIVIKNTEKEKLDVLADGANHQGFVAMLLPTTVLKLKDYLKIYETAPTDLILILDSIFDPHNFGACLRAAECFGVSAVMWSPNRGCDLTPTARKSAVGASELVNLIKESNLANAVRNLKDAGYWIVAADAGEEAKDLTAFEFPAKTALILGSEGQGIHELLRKLADFRVQIPMFGKIDSLNVSQAAAVFMYAAKLGQAK